MSNLKRIPIDQLFGAALDWAVAQAEGWPVEITPISQYGDASTGHKMKATGYLVTMAGEDGERKVCSPSTDWSQGGPLIDAYRIWLTPPTFDELYPDEPSGWDADVYTKTRGSPMFVEMCTTALVASCRVVVSVKIGRNVMVPAELVTA